MNRKDIKTLKDYCLAPVREILNNEMFLFIDNNSSVLGVAHADVYFPQKQWYFVYDNTLNLAFSPNLDDRLGVFLLLEYLPRFVKIDVLITDDEEIELSTGKFFHPEKEYNWMVEFDKSGDGIAIYNYKWDVKYLYKYFDPIVEGNYSDICAMYHLKTMAFNVGINYYDAHQINCYAPLDATRENIEKFLYFYEENKDKKFPFQLEKEVEEVLEDEEEE